MNQNLYSVEKELFKRMLIMGHAFLSEVIARRGTGKTDGPVEVREEILPYHLDKERTYLSIFGEVEINRTYYWWQGKEPRGTEEATNKWGGGASKSVECSRGGRDGWETASL